MFYRRKVILSLLEAFGGELEKLQLQKLLMLFGELQKEPNYYFVPYKFGCFSFQANADLSTMKKYELVEETEKSWQKKNDENYVSQLKEADRIALNRLKNKFTGKTSEDLIKYTYSNFPYYTLNSTIARKYVTDSELKTIKEKVNQNQKSGLFTIGYEGVSIEQYINKLIHENIKVLCDVRKNSFSMKYGFSKSQLKMACEGVGIKFIHIPEVGIVSDKRKKLETQSDYDELFEDYKQTVLPETIDKQKFIVELIQKYKRVALTCFEKDICQCHRKHLAEAVCELPEFKYELIHLN
ncbi:MAG: DUF488 domain-containing protein [Crocinitomicaceae bacterium]|nr:DUF488 domain-containing protein [Crocinitomicaceae bacterium]